MRNLTIISILVLLSGAVASCNKKMQEEPVASQEDITLSEIDSILTYEDEERCYLSMMDMEPFNSCAVVGSLAYRKDFNIDIFLLNGTDSAYIVMSEVYDKDEKGNTLWRMTDSVKIYFPIGSSIGWPGHVVKDGAIDYDLMALMPDDTDWIDTEVYTDLLGVWRLSSSEKTITPIPAENISCINESYGVY